MAVHRRVGQVGWGDHWERVFAEPITHRYTLVNGHLQRAGSTTNTGIASYICEVLCGQELPHVNSQLAEKWAGALVDRIACEAVQSEGAVLWCWEKMPSREDYKYPPDWDDVCKSIDAIRAYQDKHGRSTDVTLPSCAYVERSLQSLVFESEYVGEEVKYRCRNRRALLMFMVGRDQKGNNTEDVMVTAVVVRCILKNYHEIADRNEDLVRELNARLVEVASWGLTDNVSFSYVSRCYFSWAHFLLVLNDIADLSPIIGSDIRSVSEQYIKGGSYEALLQPNVRKHLLRDGKRPANPVPLARVLGIIFARDGWSMAGRTR